MIEITAVVTTRNRERFLGRALHSIATQQYRPAEVVVVDDASDYNVRQVLRTCVLPVRFIRLAHCHGVSRARNIGAAASRSGVLAFLDDDDEWHPHYLRRVAEAFVYARAEVSCCSFVAVTATGNEYDEKTAPASLVWSDFLVRNPGLRGSNVAITANAYDEIGGFDEALASFNDVDIGIRLARANLRYVAIPERLVRYHVHDGLRLSTPGTPLKRESCRLFFAKHEAVMSPQQRQVFREKAEMMWKVSLAAD